MLFNIKKKSRLGLLFFLILFWGCASSNRLNLFYSSNLNGIIEDCRCPKTTEGTVLNHYTFYSDSIKTHSNNYYLSAGNIFSYYSQDKENRVVLDVLNDLGYDIICPGRNDIAFIDSLKDISAVSFNINRAEPYYIIRSNNIVISVTGLISPEFNKITKEKIIQKKTFDEINDHVRELKNRSDIVIFVSNMDPSKEKELFKDIKEIDIMISAANQKKQHYEFGERQYVSAGMFGDFIGRLSFVDTGEKVLIYNDFITVDRNIFPDHPGLKQKTDSLKNKYGIDTYKKVIPDFDQEL